MKRLLLLAVLVFSFGFSVQAQSDWQITVLVQNDVFAGDANLRLITIQPSGVNETVLTTALTGVQVWDAALSPDGRYLAVALASISDGNAVPLYLYDLGTGQIRMIDNPAGMSSGLIEVGGFSPDSTRLALSYVGTDYSRTDNPFTGGAFIVDAASGAIINNTPIDVLNPALPYQGMWLLMGEWKADGVRVAPNCYACEGAYEGEYAIWNPDTNAIIPQSGEFFSSFGDVLDGTGEMVYVARDDRFPGDPMADRFPTPNVVLYFPDGQLPRYDQRTDASVAYFEPDDIRLDGRVHWVNNGRGFLIFPYDTAEDNAHYANRNGVSDYYTLTGGYHFMGGTPDGWVWAAPVDGTDLSLPPTQQTFAITHMTPDVNGVLMPTPLGTVQGFASERIVQAPELGFVAGLTPLPTIPPPSPEEFAAILSANMPQCPGLMPSRLFAGATAQVTPGDPNRLRDQPSRNGAILGEIPGGAAFMVIEGPICSDDIAWWQVNYNGMVGYTAEFQGSTYFVEPLS